MGGAGGGTYYDVLDVTRAASSDAIERAYRTRVKEVHPDRNDDEDAAAQFRRVRRAREVLCDPDERARYDRLGHDAYVAATTGVTSSNGWREASRPDPGTAGGRRAASTGSTESTTRGSTSGTGRRDNRRASSGAGGASASSTADPDATGDGSGAGDDAGSSWGGPSPGGGWSRRGNGASSSDADGNDSGSGSATADWQHDRRAQAGSGGSAYAVRREHAAPRVDTRFRLSSSRTALAFAMFLVYPGLLYSSVAPSLPLWVNAIVAACTLLAVAFVLTDPEVGIAAFGPWLVVGPVVLTASGVGVLSLAGGAFLLACVLPFALALTNRFLMQA